LAFRFSGEKPGTVRRKSELSKVVVSSRDVLDRHVRIDAVLVVQVDRIDSQALERLLGHPPDVLGPAVESERLPVRIEFEAELGGDRHPIAEWRERLAQEVRVRERAVDLSGIEERHATLHGRAYQGDHVVPIACRSEAGAHAHAPEANR